MKRKKFMIGLVVAISIIFLVWGCNTILNMNEAKAGSGNNLIVYSYSRGVKNNYYETIEDGINDEIDKREKILFIHEDKNIIIVFTQLNDAITGYEFLILPNSKIEYIGAKKNIVDGADEEEHSWNETFKSDLSYSLSNTYLKFTKYGEDYLVLPAWGVTSYGNVQSLNVNGMMINETSPLDINGDVYYLWIINDVSSISSVENIKIEEN